MNTKEAIEFLGKERSRYPSSDVQAIIRYDEVIDLLKRGEKFEQMFNTVLNWTIHDGSFIPVKELINLERKYFPKPVKKTITIEIEGEDDIELQLATVVMKKALDDWDFKKDIVKNFKVVGD